MGTTVYLWSPIELPLYMGTTVYLWSPIEVALYMGTTVYLWSPREGPLTGYMPKYMNIDASSQHSNFQMGTIVPIDT